jgi:lysophospholipase L1-like esterase
MRNCLTGSALALAAVLAAAPALAQSPQVSDTAIRYMALGDSIAAGFKAQPTTHGYAFLLYQNGAFAPMALTRFNDIAAVGATSDDVLMHQVPQAIISAARGGFQPQFLTLTVGGNDIAAIQRGQISAPAALAAYASNLSLILSQLAIYLPGAKVYVGNQYTVPEIEAQLPGASLVIGQFNAATALAVSGFPNAYLVDVHSAFRDRTGLLLIERHGAAPFEVHLTNAGHRVMAETFAKVIAAK